MRDSSSLLALATVSDWVMKPYIFVSAWLVVGPQKRILNKKLHQILPALEARFCSAALSHSVLKEIPCKSQTVLHISTTNEPGHLKEYKIDSY